MNPAEVVRTARRRAGLTQRQLGKRATTSQSAIARYEGGSVVPSVETLTRLVEACGLALEVTVTGPSHRHLVADLLVLSPRDRLDTLSHWAELRRRTRVRVP